MKKIEDFTTPLKRGFEEYADGAVYRALQGEDYENRRTFLAALTRWAGQNSFTVERVVTDEAVEFRFVKVDPVVAVAEAARKENTAEPF
jgi:hypothetical protein